MRCISGDNRESGACACQLRPLLPRFSRPSARESRCLNDSHRFPYAAANQEAARALEPVECQNRVGNPYRYWGQHLHARPTSYLVIAAVASCYPVS